MKHFCYYLRLVKNSLMKKIIIGFLFLILFSNISFGQSGSQFSWVRITDYLALNKQKNNVNGDSVLVTDINGKVKQVHKNSLLGAIALNQVLSNGNSSGFSAYFGDSVTAKGLVGTDLKNISGDSILTTDANGKLKLIYFTGSGTSNDNLDSVLKRGNISLRSAYFGDSIFSVNGVFSDVSAYGGGFSNVIALDSIKTKRLISDTSYINTLPNNISEDSVLTTDTNGKLKLKYINTSGSQDLQSVTDIDNRTDNSIYTTDSIRANEGVFNLIAMNGLDRNINNVNEITGTQSNFSIGNVYDSLRLNYIKNNLAGDSILTTTHTTGKIINIHKNSLGFVKYTDTSAMLNPYLRKIDTATLSNRIDSLKNVIYGQQYTYDIALTQTRNSINLPYKGHKVSLDSIQLVGAVTGVSYTLYKTVSGVPTAGATRTTLSAINADIAALTTGEVNATYQILILFTFLAGAEYGGSVLFAHKL